MAKKIKNKNVEKEIKRDLSKILIIPTTIIMLILLIILFPKGNNNTQITLQIIEHDIKDNSTEIIKEIKVKENEIIKLNEYSANDIKISSINEENVTISRDVRKYEIISQNGPYDGEAIDYIQTLIEKIEYDTLFEIDIDERNPFGPEYAQARYHYNAKFTK